MFIIISPAKNLKAKPYPSKLNLKKIAFENETRELSQILKKKSIKELQSLMSISEKLALDNYHRYASFPIQFNKQNAHPAAFLFNGDVYHGLDISSITQQGLSYLEKNLGILSGLYGLLRIGTLIYPYRLEMGTALENPRGNNLYLYWKNLLTAYLNKQMSSTNNKILINLASDEYSKVISFTDLKVPTLQIKFMEKSNQTYKTMAFYAKKARGWMVRYLAENNIDNIECIKDFSTGGYKFNKNLSEAYQYIFTRVKPAKKE